VATIVVKDGRILFGRARLSDPWKLPGGTLPAFEEPEEFCRKRVLEETGLTVAGCGFLAYVNRIVPDKKQHDVTLVFVGRYVKGNLKSRPSQYQWGWFDPSLLPHPLFDSQRLFDRHATRRIKRIAAQ
jgi:ADP-ribose pyrophosphatase YjhB (NUDIX family)